MALRTRHTAAELGDAVDRVARNPDGWRRAVDLDVRRFGTGGDASTLSSPRYRRRISAPRSRYVVALGQPGRPLADFRHSTDA